MRIFRALTSLALLACLSPLLSMALAEILGQIHGCKVDFVSTQPCMDGNEDISGTLRTLGMMGYFLMATLPVAAGVVATWIIVELVAWARRRTA